MTVVERVVNGNMSQVVDLSILEVFLLSDSQYLSTIGSCQELAFAVQQFQRIPLTRIVRSGNDNTTIGTTHANGQLGGRRRSITDVQHVKAHAYKGTTNHVTHHVTRKTTIAANHYPTRLARDKGGVCRCKLHDIQWIQRITRASANGSADAGNRFNQRHSDS